MNRTDCPNCQHRLKYGAEQAGKNVSCPRCRHRFRLPVPAATKSVQEDEQRRSLDREALGRRDGTNDSAAGASLLCLVYYRVADSRVLGERLAVIRNRKRLKQMGLRAIGSGREPSS